MSASTKGPNLISNGLEMAAENRNHWNRARNCKNIAARNDQDALSHEASSLSRDARLFLELSKLVNVAFTIKF